MNMLGQTGMMEWSVVFLLCAVNVCSAQNDDVCGSCKDNCGSHVTYCGCDALCKVYNDCCSDFENVCPLQRLNGTAILFRFRGVSVTQLAECRRVNFEARYRNVPLVTACPHDEHACSDVGSGRADVTNLVPVTELSTGLNFVSAGCAECNGVTEARVWDTKLTCDDRVYAQLQVDNSTSNSSQVRYNTLQDLLVHPDCSLAIRIPVEARRPCDPDIIDTCTDGSGWSEKQCHFGITDFVTDLSRNYKNKECVRCNAVTRPIWCGLNMVFALAPVIDGKFSMSLLLDYSGSGLMLKSGSCEVGYAKVAHDCLPIVCPHDFVLVENDCVEIPKVDVSIHFHVTLDPGGESSRIKDLLSNPDFLLKNTQIFLQDRYDKITNLTVLFNVSAVIELYSIEGSNLYIAGLISYTVHNMSAGNPSAHLDLMDLSHVIQNTLREVFDREVQGSVSKLIVEMKPLDDDDFEVWEQPSRSCSLILLSKNKYTLQNGSIYVLSTGQKIELKHVSFGKNGSVTVCESEMTRNPLSSSSALGITTIVVLSISLLCLLLRLVLQSFISAFHTAPMKLQFCLSLSLFTGFLAFLVSPFLSEGSVPCQGLGIYIHWVFLLAFSWMMVIAFDMWWIFRPSGGFMKLSEGAGFFWRYLIIAVLCASVITAVSLMFEYAPISEPFKPHYGQFLCFFNNTRALLVFFVIPLIGIVVINLIFFSVTCFNLHRALSSMQKFQQQKWRQELCLYIRLFSLMGITWLFGIVAPLVRSNDVLWYLFIIFNGLQGLYIFAAYVCTQKVYNELRRMCGGKEPKQSQQMSGSESMTSRGSKKGRFSSTSDGNRTVDTSVSDHDRDHFKNGNRTADTLIPEDVEHDETDTVNLENTNGMKKPPHETSV